MPHWELIPLFFVVAFVYASVGFGGGSSYLAILAMYSLPFQELRLTALVCNIVVVSGGAYLYWRNGQLNGRKILPLALLSVPMAFLGARLRIGEDTFFILLGLTLLAAAVLLWWQPAAPIRITARDVARATACGVLRATTRVAPTDDRATPPIVARLGMNDLKNGFLGGGIGFLSGMVGIGGGIFLSPVLNLMRWDDSRKIAATASFFILVNSAAGIAGQLVHLPTGINYFMLGLLAAAVLAGGQAGSRLGVSWFEPRTIRRITALLVFVAGMEVLFKHLN